LSGVRETIFPPPAAHLGGFPPSFPETLGHAFFLYNSVLLMSAWPLVSQPLDDPSVPTPGAAPCLSLTKLEIFRRFLPLNSNPVRPSAMMGSMVFVCSVPLMTHPLSSGSSQPPLSHPELYSQVTEAFCSFLERLPRLSLFFSPTAKLRPLTAFRKNFFFPFSTAEIRNEHRHFPFFLVPRRPISRGFLPGWAAYGHGRALYSSTNCLSKGERFRHSPSSTPSGLSPVMLPAVR